MRYLLGSLWLRLFGWRLIGLNPLPPKLVLIAAPHTSNWDLPHMIGAAFVLRAKIYWLGKDAIFRNRLFGRWMKALGGIPIVRGTRGNTVALIAERFRNTSSLILAVPPEGTRSRCEFWRSGFYHIAVAAEVPIGLGFLDYSRRRLGVAELFEPSGNVGIDMDRLREFYGQMRGKYPDKAGTPRLREEKPIATSPSPTAPRPP